MTKVAILGAGVNGLTCAVKIKEKYPEVEVVIISNEFTPNTTGDGSGGFWNPYLCGSTSQELLAKWGIETYKYIHKLWLEGGYDICAMPMYELHRVERRLTDHKWAKDVFGYQILEKKQLDFLSWLYTVKYVAGRTFTSFVIYPPSILARMHEQFKNYNGKVVKAKITSLDDPILTDYDVIVNCTGLGARDLVPDNKVFPIRGQIMRVNADWINYTIIDEDTGHYIIPNIHMCVLGGTHQENNFSYKVNPEDTDFIMSGCKELMPGLKYSKVEKQWVGLRPGRTQVRLETERRKGKLYIHNYGHGGSGFTLFWGCGSDVLALFDKHVEEETKRVKSKL